jgi:hypothetical protein
MLIFLFYEMNAVGKLKRLAEGNVWHPFDWRVLHQHQQNFSVSYARHQKIEMLV